MTDIDDLRRLANEPEGDSDYDDADLEEILLRNQDSIPAAAAEIWRNKAAAAAELVDMREGETARNLSDLSGAALKMAAELQKQADAGNDSGIRATTIGRITRA
jgi:hypothetical protein